MAPADELLEVYNFNREEAYYEVDTEDFIRQLLPANVAAHEILSKLIATKFYDSREKRWVTFPEQQGQESLYKAFTDISNAIVRSIPQESVQTGMFYLDRNSVTAGSDVPSDRPAGTAASFEHGTTALDRKIKGLEECSRGLAKQGNPLKEMKSLEPEMFIGVIAAFSCMTPEQLGWDTDMKIYLPSTGVTKSSYEVGDDWEGVYGDTRGHVHRVIDVAVNKKIEKYVTVAIIYDIYSFELFSGAPIVYEVIKFSERFNPTQTFALKRYWRPVEVDEYPCEGKIHEVLNKNKTVGRKYLHAFDEIEVNGKLDTTFTLIRQNLKGKQSLPRSNLSTYELVDR
ncbi:hypothetical protein C0991_003407, partial [Blastosporella zonata]